MKSFAPKTLLPHCRSQHLFPQEYTTPSQYAWLLETLSSHRDVRKDFPMPCVQVETFRIVLRVDVLDDSTRWQIRDPPWTALSPAFFL